MINGFFLTPRDNNQMIVKKLFFKMQSQIEQYFQLYSQGPNELIQIASLYFVTLTKNDTRMVFITGGNLRTTDLIKIMSKLVTLVEQKLGSFNASTIE